MASPMKEIEWGAMSCMFGRKVIAVLAMDIRGIYCYEIFAENNECSPLSRVPQETHEPLAWQSKARSQVT